MSRTVEQHNMYLLPLRRQSNVTAVCSMQCAHQKLRQSLQACQLTLSDPALHGNAQPPCGALLQSREPSPMSNTHSD